MNSWMLNRVVTASVFVFGIAVCFRVDAQEDVARQTERMMNDQRIRQVIGLDRLRDPVSIAEEVLANNEKTLGIEHPDTAQSRIRLAGLYSAAGAYARAEGLYEKAQEAYETNRVRFILLGSESRKLQYMRRAEDQVSSAVSLSLIHRSARSTALGVNSEWH